MVIFNSYVKLPEVKWVFIVLGIQSHCTILYPSLRTSQDYIMDDKKLGEGSFGQVCVVTQKLTGQKRAMKRVGIQTEMVTEQQISKWFIYGLSMVYRCVTIPSIHKLVGYPMGRSGSCGQKSYEPTMTGDGFYIALIEMVMTWGWIIVGYTTLEVNDKEYVVGPTFMGTYGDSEFNLANIIYIIYTHLCVRPVRQAEA